MAFFAVARSMSDFQKVLAAAAAGGVFRGGRGGRSRAITLFNLSAEGVHAPVRRRS